jgi:hypothetical protein
MGKLIAWLVFGAIVIYLSGLFPQVAVLVTAVSITFLFLFSKWLGE